MVSIEYTTISVALPDGKLGWVPFFKRFQDVRSVFQQQNLFDPAATVLRLGFRVGQEVLALLQRVEASSLVHNEETLVSLHSREF